MLSIITINYNGSQDTIKLLESLKRQTDKDFEIIIVLNGCKDNTLSVVLNYQKKYPKIIKYLNFTDPIG